MEKKPFDLPKYLLDAIRYRGLNKRMFWFQKFKRRKWVYGQNFGDYLSFVIVGELLKKAGVFPLPQKVDNRKLLALGSIIHFANDGDVVWGSGVNGKMPDDRYRFKQLDVRMVRGPLTAKFLQNKGIDVPKGVYGDPAILLPDLFPEFQASPITGKKIVLPNFNELAIIQEHVPKDFTLVSPVGYWKSVVKDILTSELVLTSSLHGLILAERFNVPVRFVAPCGGETLFKYEDYLEGTGRRLYAAPQNFLAGINEDAGVQFSTPVTDSAAMLEKFPIDIMRC